MTKKAYEVPLLCRKIKKWVMCYLYPALTGWRGQHQIMDKFDQLDGGIVWIVFSVKLKADLIL